MFIFRHEWALNLELNEHFNRVSAEKVNTVLLMEVHKIFKFTCQLLRLIILTRK